MDISAHRRGIKRLPEKPSGRDSSLGRVDEKRAQHEIQADILAHPVDEFAVGDVVLHELGTGRARSDGKADEGVLAGHVENDRLIAAHGRQIELFEDVRVDVGAMGAAARAIVAGIADLLVGFAARAACAFMIGYFEAEVGGGHNEWE